MRRREVLRALLLVLAERSTSIADEPALRSAGRGEQGAGVAPPSGDGTPLSPPERDTLLAFAEVLVEGRPFAPAARAEMLSYIEDRVRARHEALALYRTTAALLDRLAGAGFSSVAMRERMEIVARHGLAPSRAVAPPDEGAQAARTRVAPDLIAGYYSSAPGWAVVGYATFPGRCGELERYTRREP